MESWSPPQAPSAAVLFLHGVNESAQTLTARRLAAALTGVGVAFHALEQHGHGLSLERGGKKQTLGLIQDFDLLAAHAVEACLHIAKAQAGAPVFLMGHSMGAGAAACATKAAAEALQAAGSRLAGAVYIAPPIGLIEHTPWVLKVVLRAVSAIAPSLAIGPPEHPEHYCPPDVTPPGRNYQGNFRARACLALVEFAEGGFDQRVKAGDLGQIPFLVPVGTQDEVVTMAGCERLVALGSRGELYRMDGASHQPVAEAGWEDRVSRISRWVVEALAK